MNLNNKKFDPHLSISVSYSQQFPVPVHVFPHTRHVMSCSAPKKIGLGINENKHIKAKPKPMATVLSRSSIHLTPTRKLLALPVASENLRKHITARNMKNSFWQFIGHALSFTVPPNMYSCG